MNNLVWCISNDKPQFSNCVILDTYGLCILRTCYNIWDGTVISVTNRYENLEKDQEMNGTRTLPTSCWLVVEVTIRLGSWMIMDCKWSNLRVLIEQRTHMRGSPLGSHSYRAPRQGPTIKSTLAWRHHNLPPLLYWSSRTSSRDCDSRVCPQL